MFKKTQIQGIFKITPSRFADERGFFSESWNKKTAHDNGFDIDFVQDNHSFSQKMGTLRGLHFQRPPFAQDKLVRCGRGRILDVAVDIRKDSPTFGSWVAEELSFENGVQLFVPIGCLHGFLTLEENSEIIYKCSNYYSKECDATVRFDDPDINILWPNLPVEFTLSEKDKTAPYLKDLDNPF